MSEALPLALLAVFVVLLAAMPWRHPHPNHQFMLELLRLLEEDEPTPLDFFGDGTRIPLIVVSPWT